jgi:hypothetical protein
VRAGAWASTKRGAAKETETTATATPSPGGKAGRSLTLVRVRPGSSSNPVSSSAQQSRLGHLKVDSTPDEPPIAPISPMRQVRPVTDDGGGEHDK